MKKAFYSFIFCILFWATLLCAPVFAAAGDVEDGVEDTVSYDANGGTDAPDAQVIIPGVTLVLSADEPQREGCRFMGWATSPEGSVMYEAEGEYTQEDSITLYAVWCRICASCEGTGTVEKSKTCTNCGGDSYYKGYQRCTVCIAGTVMVSEKRECHKCYAVWHAVDPNCTVCSGSGYLYTSYGITCSTCGGDTLIPTDYAVCYECIGGMIYYTASCSNCNGSGLLCHSGHTVVQKNKTLPTCTTNGSTEGAYCSTCDMIFYGIEDIAPTGHTEVVDSAVKPTCTETGLTEGGHCAVCGAVTRRQSVVGALGHSYGAFSLKDNATYYEDATEAAVCTVCGEERVITILGTKLKPNDIEIISLPDVCSYARNQDVDITGLRFLATYEDGGKAEFSAEDIDTVAADTTSVGVKTATVSYMGASATFDVYIHDIGKTEITAVGVYPESDHNYANRTDETITFACKGATQLKITFSADTYVEDGYDYIYLYNGSGILVGKYTGADAAGLTVTIPGDSFQVRLKADNVINYWGYKISEIVATMDLIHPAVIDSATVNCTQDGVTEGSHCEICGMILIPQEQKEAFGHSYTNYTSNNDATCLKDGTETAKCDRCEETNTRTEENTKLGHSFTEYKSNGNATCLADGTETAKCDRCDVTDTRTAEDSALGHDHKPTVTPPTCETIGFTTYTCTRCDDAYVTEEKQELGHSFTNYVSNNDATYDADGTKTAKCDRCDATDTVIDEDSKLIRNGWIAENGKWYYYVDDVMKTGWLQLGSTWYYMDGQGVIQTGWQQISGIWYYFKSSGAMVTGWLQSGSIWYYFNASGAMVTGWRQIGGTWYYFNSSGAMATGWLQLGNTWYYFKSGGAMATGWLQSGGKWYYFSTSGAMATSCYIGQYWVNASGAWIG